MNHQNNETYKGTESPHHIEKTPTQFSSSQPNHVTSNLPYTPDYHQMRKKYHVTTRKHQIIQIVGSIFAFITILIEWVIFKLTRRMLGSIERVRLFRMVSIFVVLFFITALAVIQLVVISKWNRQSTRQHMPLSQTHYQMINQIQFIRILIGLTILLALAFIIIYRNWYLIPIYSPEFPRIARLYNRLLQLSRLLVIIYLVFEVGQFIVWSRKARNIRRIENTLTQELSELDELTRILSSDIGDS